MGRAVTELACPFSGQCLQGWCSEQSEVDKLGLDVLLELRGDLECGWSQGLQTFVAPWEIPENSLPLLPSVPSWHSQSRGWVWLPSPKAGLGSQQCRALKYQQSCGLEWFWVHTKYGFENAGAGKSRLTAFRLIGLMVWTSNVTFYHVQQISVPNSLRRSLK